MGENKHFCYSIIKSAWFTKLLMTFKDYEKKFSFFQRCWIMFLPILQVKLKYRNGCLTDGYSQSWPDTWFAAKCILNFRSREWFLADVLNFITVLSGLLLYYYKTLRFVQICLWLDYGEGWMVNSMVNGIGKPSSDSIWVLIVILLGKAWIHPSL